MMDFVSRAQWGARKPTSVSTSIKPVGVTIHWEGPRMGSFPHSQCASKVRSIQGYHLDTKKWADVAYSAIVCPHGYVYEGRGVGKRTAANGTDAGNDSWYAVCALAGTGDVTTPALLTGLDDAIGWLRRNGAGSKVNGHRDHKPTDCPGDYLYRWAHGPHDTATPKPPPAPTPERGDDPMLILARREGEDTVWVSNGVARRHIPSPAALTDLQTVMTRYWHYAPEDAEVKDFGADADLDGVLGPADPQPPRAP